MIVGYPGSCICRPARRRLSSIWSFSVMRSSKLSPKVDTVSRNGLWKIMAKFGCPHRFIAMVQQFHGMQARVQNDGKFSEPFEQRMVLNKAVLWYLHCSA